MSRASEIVAEQLHFDHAAAEREKRIAAAADAVGAAAHQGAVGHLGKHAEAVAKAMGAASLSVAFGRVDANEERLYVGRHLIRDSRGEILVISWQADAAAPFYSATHAAPMGVSRKRTFECTGNTIANFADVLFGLEPEKVDEFLHRVLSRGRTGTMRDIVATIQAAQYDVIRAPLDQILVIEGGPGTGKTAIALHRVSWMLAQVGARLRARDILLVGPNPTFTRYIRDVLPDLGDTDVQIRDIGQLAPDVPKRGRTEPAEVAALKGDARMAGLLARSLEARIGQPEPVERLPAAELDPEKSVRLYRQGERRVDDEVWSGSDLHLLDELHHGGGRHRTVHRPVGSRRLGRRYPALCGVPVVNFAVCMVPSSAGADLVLDRRRRPAR
jgi:hypothetical protein